MVTLLVPAEKLKLQAAVNAKAMAVVRTPSASLVDGMRDGEVVGCMVLLWTSNCTIWGGFASVFRTEWGGAVRCDGPSVRLRPGGVRRRRSARRCPTLRPLVYATVPEKRRTW